MPIFIDHCVEHNSYIEGDFMLHFAGKKGRVREELVEYYYPKAKQVL